MKPNAHFLPSLRFLASCLATVPRSLLKHAIRCCELTVALGAIVLIACAAALLGFLS